MNRLAKKIKDERIKAGLSEKELAQKCGMQISYILQIESGKKIINEKIAEQILKSLGTRVTSLSEEASVEEKSPEKQKSVVGQTVQNKPVTPNESWGGVLKQLLYEVPVYKLNHQEIMETIAHPVVNNKVEGYSGDKLYYLYLDRDVYKAGRLCKDDLVLIVQGKALYSDGLYHFKYQNKQYVGRIQTVDKKRVLVKSDLLNKEVSQSELDILGRCIKVSFKVS